MLVEGGAERLELVRLKRGGAGRSARVQNPRHNSLGVSQTGSVPEARRARSTRRWVNPPRSPRATPTGSDSPAKRPTEKRGIVRCLRRRSISSCSGRTREQAHAELGRFLSRRERVEDLERNRDAVIESYVGMLPGALDTLSGGERERARGRTENGKILWTAVGASRTEFRIYRVAKGRRVMSQVPSLPARRRGSP
jgi:hypothetical protein